MSGSLSSPPSPDKQILSPREISESLTRIAQAKATASVQELFFLAVLAGVYIGFGAVVATAVTSGSGMDDGLRRFLGGSAFSVGLMLVLIPGSELFTGNILMTLGLLSNRMRLPTLVRNWIIVWIGNFAGAMLLAWLMYESKQLVDGQTVRDMGVRAIAIANRKIELAASFAPCFIRGVLCNMLVCLAVIMASATRTMSGKILAVYFPIMTFVACDFEHSIANMYFIPAGLLTEGHFGDKWGGMMLNLLAVTLGNIVGGLTLIILHPKNQRMLAGLFRRRNMPG